MAQILFADDDADLGFMVQFSLEDVGHTVTLAHDGHEAREAALSGTYDLILLDVMMPQVDGFALCRELSARPDGPKVVMVSARDRNSDLAEGEAAGAVDYIVKPFGVEDLRNRVQELVGPTQ